MKALIAHPIEILLVIIFFIIAFGVLVQLNRYKRQHTNPISLIFNRQEFHKRTKQAKPFGKQQTLMLSTLGISIGIIFLYIYWRYNVITTGLWGIYTLICGLMGLMTGHALTDEEIRSNAGYQTGSVEHFRVIMMVLVVLVFLLAYSGLSLPAFLQGKFYILNVIGLLAAMSTVFIVPITLLRIGRVKAARQVKAR